MRKRMTILFSGITFLLMVLPGIVFEILGGMFLFMIVPAEAVGILTNVIVIVLNAAAAGAAMFICRNMLQYAELNNR